MATTAHPGGHRIPVRGGFERETDVGRKPLEYRPGHRYGLLVDARGTSLSVHDDLDGPDLVWVTGTNRRGDYRPALLDRAQARALRDALDLFLADQDPFETQGA
jgi:hypothetical protein